MNFTPQWDQKSKATGVIIRLYLENDSFQDVQNKQEELLSTRCAQDLFLFINHDMFDATSSNISSKIKDITKTCLSQYYKNKYPILLSEIKDRLNKISLRKENWDGLGSKKPEIRSLSRAHVLLEGFLKAVIDNGDIWRNPFISSDEDGYVSMEWHKGTHELHIEVREEEEEFIKIWGTNIEHDMHIDLLDESSYVLLWDWLVHE